MSQKEKSPELYAVDILLRQIDEESSQSMLWIISAINRCLIENKNMTLKEFKNLIKQSCSDFYNVYKACMYEKELCVID
jgi:hypothetical protein